MEFDMKDLKKHEELLKERLLQGNIYETILMKNTYRGDGKIIYLKDIQQKWYMMAYFLKPYRKIEIDFFPIYIDLKEAPKDEKLIKIRETNFGRLPFYRLSKGEYSLNFDEDFGKLLTDSIKFPVTWENGINVYFNLGIKDLLTKNFNRGEFRFRISFKA